MSLAVTAVAILAGTQILTALGVLAVEWRKSLAK